MPLLNGTCHDGMLLLNTPSSANSQQVQLNLKLTRSQAIVKCIWQSECELPQGEIHAYARINSRVDRVFERPQGDFRIAPPAQTTLRMPTMPTNAYWKSARERMQLVRFRGIPHGTPRAVVSRGSCSAFIKITRNLVKARAHANAN